MTAPSVRTSKGASASFRPKKRLVADAPPRAEPAGPRLRRAMAKWAICIIIIMLSHLLSDIPKGAGFS